MLAVAASGRLYAGYNSDTGKHDHDSYNVIEFAPGATSPGPLQIGAAGKYALATGLAVGRQPTRISAFLQCDQPEEYNFHAREFQNSAVEAHTTGRCRAGGRGL